jgi:hypothetical protein
MRSTKNLLATPVLVAGLFYCFLTCGLLFIAAESACAQAREDPRKKTTIQTASADIGSTKNAVEVRYLDLPFGERTFGYLESGVDTTNGGYYASRDWPIAQLTLATKATWEGKTLDPGDYILIISPKNPGKNTPMMLSIASFKPATSGGTFLQPGNVFVQVPKDAVVITQKPVTFDTGGPASQHLEISLAKKKPDVAINIHYGNRSHSEKLRLQ